MTTTSWASVRNGKWHRTVSDEPTFTRDETAVCGITFRPHNVTWREEPPCHPGNRCRRCESTSRRKLAQVAEATAYVRTRFYPPLPAAYGPLAVRAVDACNSGRPAERIAVGHLELIPQQAFRAGNGRLVVTARALVSALRLEHMLEDQDD